MFEDMHNEINGKRSKKPSLTLTDVEKLYENGKITSAYAQELRNSIELVDNAMEIVPEIKTYKRKKFFKKLLIAVLIVVCAFVAFMYFYYEWLIAERTKLANELMQKIDSIGQVTLYDTAVVDECFLLYNSYDPELQKRVLNYSELVYAQELLDLIELNPTPEHGVLSTKYKETRRNPLAPFKIDLSQCSEDDFYFIKLLDYNTKEVKQTVFMHPKTTLEIDLPLGDYELRYCYGSVWYGYDELFGTPYGGYAKTDDKFSCTQDAKYVYGHTVSLYNVPGGNLHSIDISQEAFQ